MAAPAPVTFESFAATLGDLVARFDRQHPQFTSPDYNEATLRADFLDPFFRALGWDVGNTKGLMSRGSSTGDDEVFILSADNHLVEKSMLRTPVFATDFGRYRFEPSQEWRIIFPYVDDDGDFRLLKQTELKKDFPKAFDYLSPLHFESHLN